MLKPDDENAPKGPDETTPYPGAKSPRNKSEDRTATSPSPHLAGLGTPVPDDRETRKVSVTTPSTPAPPSGPADFQARFSPGQVVANRYKVRAFIGQGGMGEVYEVEDLELKEHVALKTIRPEVAQDQKMIERFKREIQLARNVTHPNVCRIFDLGFHRTGEASGDVMFLTMELLSGETLSARIRRVVRLKTSEALPIAVQMTAALAAAHKAGIIHRDFKSGNVILVPSKEGTRVVVTDFGLARRSQTSGAAQAAESAGSLGTASSSVSDIIGTPAYMAPEQVRGDPVTASTDIYALGVVLYEMVTGTWPFTGDNPLAVAAKRLEGPPTPPRKHVADLDPRWESTILRCLKRDPSDRIGSALEVAAALGGHLIDVAPSRSPTRWVGWAAVAAVILATVAVFVAAFRTMVRAPLTQAKFDEPPGAELFIDGADQGRLPLRVPVNPGHHAYKLIMAGVKPLEHTFDVAKGETLNVVEYSTEAAGVTPSAGPSVNPPRSPKTSVLIGGTSEAFPEELFQKANEAYNVAKFEEACDILTKLAQVAPGYKDSDRMRYESCSTAKTQHQVEDTLFKRGVDLYNQGKYDDAKAAFQKARGIPLSRPAHRSDEAQYLTQLSGRLTVESDPSGAQITVDGKTDSSWVTPTTFQTILLGSHRVSLSLRKYQTVEQTVEVQKGQAAAVRVRLTASVAQAPVQPLPRAVGPPGTVIGNVYDTKGIPASGAQVRLINPLTGFSRTELTDDAGSFEFDDVPATDATMGEHYFLSLDKTGFEREERRFSLGAGQTIWVIPPLRLLPASTSPPPKP